MAAEVSDRLREALERLDQAIDRLDVRVTLTLEQSESAPPAGGALNATLAERLDKLIERIEAALVD